MNNKVAPFNEIGKNTWADLLDSGFERIPNEKLENLVSIIGTVPAFDFLFNADNMDSDDLDNGELCTVCYIPFGFRFDNLVELVVAPAPYDSKIKYLYLTNRDEEEPLKTPIFSFPLKEIDDFIFSKGEEEIEIYFRYRTLSISLILKCFYDETEEIQLIKTIGLPLRNGKPIIQQTENYKKRLEK